jgi:single-stranded-DNA-specific exonuclease
MGEGYGLNRRLIDDAVSKGCGTIIALDFGTTQHQMLRYAADQGLNTIVIDHHQLGRFPVPPADALINPHVSQREFREMCAAGLTWLFCQELCRDLGSAFDCRSTLSLAALATIADVVPLIGVNRSIVQHGLPLIPDHPGLEVLRKEAGLPRDLTSGDVAFQLGPMINAPGRILPFGARHCLDLLVGEPSKHLTAALELIDANRRRKERERIDTSRALGLIGSRPLQRGLVIESDFFDPGVVGLVASRLAERYARPTAIIACNSPQVGRASVRGALGFDVYEGLASCSHLFERFGGHKAAGGFAIQRAKIPELQRTFAAAVQQQLGVFQTPTIEADLFFDPQKISLAEAAEQLAAFEPFGNANEAPRVYLKQASITDIQSIGTEHFRVELRSGGITIDGYLWRGEGNSILKRKAGEEFPILGRVSSYLKPSGGSFSRTAAFEILAHG